MSNIKLLDCTLRDGGYVNNWDFTPNQISHTVHNLTNAGIEYIEIGYLTSLLTNVNGSSFLNVESASRFLPEDKKGSKYLIMADVAQFDTETLCKRTSAALDGIRVVFYKRQIEQAYLFCEKVCEMGYDLFLQPMVTVDYSLNEFYELCSRFCERYQSHTISVVDSFGCMTVSEIWHFIEIIEKCTNANTKIGFHGHNNMQFAQTNAISLFDYQSNREFIIDASVSGIGRGAGNLYTEIIAMYYNRRHNGNYKIESILNVASELTEPLSRTHKWGYSPYLMLTAMRRAHPNFSTYLLDNHQVSVNEFAEFIQYVPNDMLTKCTRPYVEELYHQFVQGRK
jgi:4-hydroxy 2-oxovalerate aldolase